MRFVGVKAILQSEMKYYVKVSIPSIMYKSNLVENKARKVKKWNEQ